MFDKIREAARLYKALGQYNEIKKEIDMNDAKHILLSKTFWINVGGLGITLAGLLPQKWALPVITVANLINRLATGGPITLNLDDLKKGVKALGGGNKPEDPPPTIPNFPQSR